MAKRLKWLGIGALLLLTLSSCASADQTAQKGKGASESRVAGGQAASSVQKQDSQENIEIVNKGFTQLSPDSIGNSYVSFGAILRNPNTSDIAENVSVNISLYDADGKVVKSTSETISAILPEQSVAVGDSKAAQGASRIEVQALVGRWTRKSGTLGSFTTEGITTTTEQYGGMKTNATLASTFKKDLKSVKTVAVYFNGDSVVGGSFTFVDFVPAGGKVGLEIRGFSSIPGVTRTEIYVDITSLTLLQ